MKSSIETFKDLERMMVVQAGLPTGCPDIVLYALRNARCLVSKAACSERPIPQIVIDAIKETATSSAKLVVELREIQKTTANLSPDQQMDISILTTAITTYPNILAAVISPILRERCVFKTTTPKTTPEEFSEKCKSIQRQLETLDEKLFQSQCTILDDSLRIKIGVVRLGRCSHLLSDEFVFEAITCAFDEYTVLLDLCIPLLDSTKSPTGRRIVMLALGLGLGDFLRAIDLTTDTLDSVVECETQPELGGSTSTNQAPPITSDDNLSRISAVAASTPATPATLATPATKSITYSAMEKESNEMLRLYNEAGNVDRIDEGPPQKRQKVARHTVKSEQDLNEEDKLLIILRDEVHMPYEEIAHELCLLSGTLHRIPDLQIRLKRLREDLYVWTEKDIEKLQSTYNWWAEEIKSLSREVLQFWTMTKLTIISRKMSENNDRKWSDRECKKKWDEINLSTPKPNTPIFDQQPASILAQGPAPTASVTASNISVVSQHHKTSRVVYAGSEQGPVAVRLPPLDLSGMKWICFGTLYIPLLTNHDVKASLDPNNWSRLINLTASISPMVLRSLHEICANGVQIDYQDNGDCIVFRIFGRKDLIHYVRSWLKEEELRLHHPLHLEPSDPFYNPQEAYRRTPQGNFDTSFWISGTWYWREVPATIETLEKIQVQDGEIREISSVEFPSQGSSLKRRRLISAAASVITSDNTLTPTTSIRTTASGRKAPFVETWSGIVRSKKDAWVIFQACQTGHLPFCQQRMRKDDSNSIKSGTVYVYSEGQGLSRWTDHKKWGKYKAVDDCFLYEEVSGVGLTKLTYTGENSKGERLHLINYYLPAKRHTLKNVGTDPYLQEIRPIEHDWSRVQFNKSAKNTHSATPGM